MKIIDYIKNKYSACDLESISDFDYTQLEENEIFDGIKHAIELSGNWIYLGLKIDVKLLMTLVSDAKLDDEKYYPLIKFRILAKSDKKHHTNAYVTISPFGCVQVDGDLVHVKTMKSNISAAISSFMANEFGGIYTDKHQEYWETVKRLKTEKAKVEAEKKIKEVNEEYEENIIKF